MAQEQYRLQPVLEKREREKEAANKRLQELKKQVEYEIKKLETLREMRRQVDVKKEQCTAQFEEIMLKPGVDISEEALRHDRYQVVLDKEALAHDQAVAQQQQVIREAEARVEEGKQALLQSSVDVQAMDKHKEQWAHEVKVEEDRVEEATQDELGEVMWLQQRRDKQR